MQNSSMITMVCLLGLANRHVRFASERISTRNNQLVVIFIRQSLSDLKGVYSSYYKLLLLLHDKPITALPPEYVRSGVRPAHVAGDSALSEMVDYYSPRLLLYHCRQTAHGLAQSYHPGSMLNSICQSGSSFPMRGLAPWGYAIPPDITAFRRWPYAVRRRITPEI